MPQARAIGIPLEALLAPADPVVENALRLLRTDPGKMLSQLWTRSPPDEAADNRAPTPRLDVVTALREVRDRGHALVLIADDRRDLAENVARDLGLFDKVLAKHEADADSVEMLQEMARPSAFEAWTAALRVHQWLKNVLVFAPLLLAHQMLDWRMVAATVAAFVAFSLTASAFYLLNDAFDVAADRRHPTKCRRPIAAGHISVRRALAAVPLLLLLAGGIAVFLPPIFAAVLAFYGATVLVYTVHLKRLLLVDVFALGGLYCLRVIAGNAATEIAPSFWLIAFCMCTFLSLALVKRYSELHRLGADMGRAGMGRGYVPADLETLAQLGIASAFAGALVLALYVDSPAGHALYRYPEGLWLVVPIVLYVLCRIWVLARRGQIPDDPVVFILRDWRSHLMALVVVAIAWASK